MKQIYLVEDNENLREAVLSYLLLEGYDVKAFDKLHNLRLALEKNTPDLLILDVMLPDGDGFQEAKNIRAKGKIPIIFLTARDTESDRITGFEIGADDYVVKPFSLKELMLRVKAVLSRCSRKEPVQEHSFLVNGHTLKIHRDAYEILVDGQSLALTQAEWKILLYLLDNAGMVIKRASLLQNSLDYFAEGSERTIDTHVKNLRQKLGSSQWIETVRGFGYRFCGKPE